MLRYDSKPKSFVIRPFKNALISNSFKLFLTKTKVYFLVELFTIANLVTDLLCFMK